MRPNVCYLYTSWMEEFSDSKFDFVTSLGAFGLHRYVLRVSSMQILFLILPVPPPYLCPTSPSPHAIY